MKRYFKHIRSTMQEALADIHIGKLNQRNRQLTKDQLQIIQSQVGEIEDELCTSADCLEKVKKQIVAERRQWITEKNIRSREQVLKEFFKDDNIAIQIAKDVAFLNAMDKCYTNGETFVSFDLED